MLMVQSIMGLRSRHHASVAFAFIAAAASYWLTVWPIARKETSQWRRKAQCVPDSALRRLAVETLERKWSNIEGAAAFAAFVPRHRRSTVIRALTSWQAAYDLADTLSEHCDSAAIASYHLHQPLASALHPAAPHHDQELGASDFEYMRALTSVARCCYRSLPSHTRTAAAAVRCAKRIAAYQALHHQHGHGALREWAITKTPPGSQLSWWETSAAAASSLASLAMIAAAAKANLSDQETNAIEATHWPWAGALHTLLDSLIDLREDAAASQPSLLDYASTVEVADRMRRLAEQAVRHVSGLSRPSQQTVLLAAMASLYLSDAGAQAPETQMISQAVAAAVGFPVRPALMVLRLRRWLGP